ncbi:MAG: hypothetical protein AAF620_16215 [Bacteroidota bacterium]
MKYDIKLPDGTPVDILIPEELVKDRLEVMKIIYPEAKAFPNHDLEILSQLTKEKR